MENNDDFIKDWMEGKISRDEIKSKRDAGDGFVREMESLISKSSQMRVPETITQEEAWKKLSAKLTDQPKEEARTVKLNRWIPLSIAASVSLLVIAFFVFRSTSVSTQLAETKIYQLPDGSEVILSADSKIAFNRWTWSNVRKVTLHGEAFFNVVKGSSFTVETVHGDVTVLGTSFNVNTRPAAFEVACFTGKVRVSSGAEEILLTKGLYTKLEPEGLTDATTFNVNQGTWRTGDFYFDATPLHQVIAELERQFNVDVVYSGDASRPYTGYFNKKDLDQALDMIFKPMSLTHSREDNNKIIVK